MTKTERTRETRAQRRLAIEEYMGNICYKCDEAFPFVCLDLHHVDPTEKDISVSQMLTYSWANIVKEMDKCEVYCACCHRLEHEEMRNEGLVS